MEENIRIGYATKEDLRYRASSGGIGTAILHYLLHSRQYGTGITFFFDREKCQYDVKLIHSEEEINVCGSVYQDIDIYDFLKKNIRGIINGIVVSCPPCQVSSIRNLLTKHNIKAFIISFCCSGQTTIEGTWCYYKFLGVSKNEIVNMQYRGNGWPSGIQIWLQDGRFIKRDNYTEPWSTIHRSQLFRPKRCFYCRRDTSHVADISLADPWLDDYKKNDKIGSTMFLVNSRQGEELVEKMEKGGFIKSQPSNVEVYEKAQRPNLQKGERIDRDERIFSLMLKVNTNTLWHTFFTGSRRRMDLYIKLIHYYLKINHLYQKVCFSQ